MINGFSIEIINDSTNEVIIPLFNDAGLTEAVRVKAFNADYDYEALFTMAKTKGFAGNGLHTDYKGILRVTYKMNNDEEQFHIKRMLTDKPITINGFSNYLTVTVPANECIIFQLLPNY
jgi:hypothetical protein